MGWMLLTLSVQDAVQVSLSRAREKPTNNYYKLD